MGTPYKMKGSPMQRNFGISPTKNVTDPSHPHDKEGGHVLTETRTDTTVTKSKGDKSSTYNMTNTVNNKDGSKTYTFTNDLGNSFKENHSTSKIKKKN